MGFSWHTDPDLHARQELTQNKIAYYNPQPSIPMGNGWGLKIVKTYELVVSRCIL